jgi:AraC family transcriptional regulator of adaptative response/methylated-DNA-[protein]-cysteine methyltransferase
MGEAMQEIRSMNAQLETGFELSKLFDEALAQINQQTTVLKAAWLDTVLGPMLVIADDTHLYLLEFITRRGLEKEVKKLRACGFAIMPGNTPPIDSIKQELQAYFSGTLTQFQTPYRVFGSPFQQKVWQILCTIPYGETQSYRDQAVSLGNPKAFRAVANANGANQLAIIIPCHRIIASDGTLGGYGGGLAVKQWLLEHEKNYRKP